LSRYVNQDDTLSVQDARTGYCGAEPKKVGGVWAAIQKPRTSRLVRSRSVPEGHK